MKGMKRWGLRRLGGKRGFTLIELLIVMVILAILAGIVIISIGGVFGTAQERAYEGARDQMQVAVGDYMSRELGDRPITGNTTQINGIAYDVIDVCLLQMSYNGTAAGTDIARGLLLSIPVSCHQNGDDNCDGAACSFYDATEAGTCDTDAHYVWATTDDGDVRSSCMDVTAGDCDNFETDGFQGIYP